MELTRDRIEEIAREVYKVERFTKDDEVWHNLHWLTTFAKAIEKELRPAPAAGDALTAAARDVLAERQRQISVEGWEPERDDTYRHGELASAAASYAQCAGLQGEGATTENAFKEPLPRTGPGRRRGGSPAPNRVAIWSRPAP
ncbi:hypothetical protein WJ978_19670 [Achromobacter xylosoxidans]